MNPARPHASYLAIVLGQAGIRRGLAVYPGTTCSDPPATGYPQDGPAAPSASLLFWLDPPDDVFEDFAAKAERYG